MRSPFHLYINIASFHGFLLRHAPRCSHTFAPFPPLCHSLPALMASPSSPSISPPHSPLPVSDGTHPAHPLNVVVTGAAGRTGSIVYKNLLEMDEILSLRAIVRTHASKERVGSACGTHKNVYVQDVTLRDGLPNVFSGMDSLIILTSSVPKIRPGSDTKKPMFYFDDGGNPEQVDYYGQINQIDVAKEQGLKHIILVSSMGITRQDHPFHHLGDGNILMWKHKSEQYLRESGISYTIIRSGLLEDEQGGCRELVVGKEDELLATPYRRIPRADLADVCIQALFHEEAKNKAFDLASKPEGDGTPTKDFTEFFRQVHTTF